MFDGQVTVLAPHLTDAGGRPQPGFADLYPDELSPEDVPSCEAVGVLGAVAGVIGSLMATEVMKLLTGVGEPLVGRLLLYDAKQARFTELRYRRGG
jgi:molybdopterin/thiamine biosynthesis adenylyltransferase